MEIYIYINIRQDWGSRDNDISSIIIDMRRIYGKLTELNDVKLWYLFDNNKSHLPSKRGFYNKLIFEKYFNICLFNFHCGMISYNLINYSSYSNSEIIIDKKNNIELFRELNKVNSSQQYDRIDISYNVREKIWDKIKMDIYKKIIKNTMIMYEENLYLYYDIVASRNRFLKRGIPSNYFAILPHEILLKILVMAEIRPK